MASSRHKEGSVRIFLVDDHPLFLDGVKALLNGKQGITVVGEAGDAETAYRAVNQLMPDLVLLDIGLPGVPGYELARQLRKAMPGVKVLVLSVHEDRSYLQLLLEAGVSGYVVKRSAGEALVHAIRTVMNGGLYLDPLLVDKLVAGIPPTKSPVEAAVSGVSLSGRERDVLQLIARGFSNKEISIRLNISTRTVETYRSRFMRKLDLQNRVDIVRYALQQGWLEDKR
jgi:DNA-binding NarL/FixJ family response regulator